MIALKKFLFIFNLFILISSQKFYDFKNEPISTFSYDMIKYYSLLTSFGYCTTDIIKNNECCKNEVIDDGWEVIDYGDIAVNGTKMFDFHYVVLRNDLYKKYAFSFPGTYSLAQAFGELTKCNSVLFEDNTENIKIDNYFYSLYSALKPYVLKENIINDIKNHPNYQILFTGHSLGGSMANLFAFSVIYNNIIDINVNQPVLLTFGQPRTGNKEFSKKFMQIFPNGLVFRIVRKGDPVPLIPFYNTLGYNYYHIGGLYIFNNEMTEYTECEYLEGEFFKNVKCYNHFAGLDLLVKAFGEKRLEVAVYDIVKFIIYCGDNHTHYTNLKTGIDNYCKPEYIINNEKNKISKI